MIVKKDIDVQKMDKLILQHRTQNLNNGNVMTIKSFLEKVGITHRVYKNAQRTGKIREKHATKIEAILGSKIQKG